MLAVYFFFSSRRRHTRCSRDWSSDVCSSDLLEQGGKIGSFTLLTHKAWNQFIDSAKVNRGRPRSLEHFRTLHTLAQLENLRRELSARWDRQMAPLGAPPSSQMGAQAEKTLMQYCDSVEDCLGWHRSTWLPLQQKFFPAKREVGKLLLERKPCRSMPTEAILDGIAVLHECFFRLCAHLRGRRCAKRGHLAVPPRRKLAAQIFELGQRVQGAKMLERARATAVHLC